MKKITIIILFILISVSGFALIYFFTEKDHYLPDNAEYRFSEIKNHIPELIDFVDIKSSNSTNEENNFPDKFNLKVPFIVQAPYANWDEVHQEACEEVAMIMADQYFDGVKKISTNNADWEILKLVDWENENLGFFKDTNTIETAQILKDYFNLNAEISEEVTADKIKQALLENKIVILPTAGRVLDNPYFSGEGPIYHMLIVRGWDKNNFVTNDPGTKRGENFKYSYENLLNAVHDWNNGDIYNGEKLMIIVSGK